MDRHLQASADVQRTSEEIRDEFLRFFEEKGHEIVPSASLVPEGDATLLFTNAGMNQFKDVFLGSGQRPYTRAVDTQKCLRVSGKHNDLEEVGHDTYHHTFFEMLGNWSFGDYFKREAIRWAWELLVEQWGLDPERLYATVHEGDEDLGLDADDEAAELWKSETPLNPDHILYEPSKENFWMMGDTGPCGPCSEIHVDLRTDAEREEIPGRELVNKDHPQVMEIWNLVFIQYNAQPDGSLETLADQHVDTGMGFERICAVLQGKSSTYDTDLFAPILQATADLCPHDYVRGYDDVDTDEAGERERVRIAMRVIADHIRTIAFAISDGVMPGNAGRGYVIRRILRRAVRYGYQTLGLREPFLHTLVDPLVEKMGGQFEDLAGQQDYVERMIRSEEESFLKTLGTGIEIFDRVTPYVEQASNQSGAVLDEMRDDGKMMDLLQKAFVDASDRDEMIDDFAAAASQGDVPGQIAFLLHDTYGFPIDLTQLMAREAGLGVDMDAYDDLMQRQKDRARSASHFDVDQSEVHAWQEISDGESSVFVGYDAIIVDDAAIRAVRKVETDEETRYEIELDRTPFYAESGGQVGDTGTLTVGGETINVLDTQQQGGRLVHTVDRLPQDPSGDVVATVDAERRRRIEAHHSATHLLHAALRDTLGDHVQQKGSRVGPDSLRFDFSHMQGVTEEELETIEHIVNARIRQNISKGEDRNVPIDTALERGAMALFGEKYGDEVRVITFDPDYSIELCGGTHVDATGELGLFRFLSEGSVAAGVRRVEAVAGEPAAEYVEAQLDELKAARQRFKSLQGPLHEEIARLQDERDRLADELEETRRNAMASKLDEFMSSATDVEGVRCATGRIGEASMDDLQALAQQLRDRMGEQSVGVLGSVDANGEKVYVVVTVSDDLVGQGLQAGDLVGELGRKLGGGGGGRPQLASAGGRDTGKLDDVLGEVPDLVRERLAG
ncbi:alanine--tRNA ligase [Longibacter salinarum]|uniref:Alanine--tRNA ligase n=1 Tax=Longibacter salinarum TaxID=1850348 RepID=A0A2A8D3I8_9BACT|nr:alanine--tRNA ligase [Longibacter salinarum]PEN15198.1 alanine--tRNA ligase [Longibacter salinarum]